MEKAEGKNLENHVSSVDASRTCINEKTNEIHRPLEDSNRNITIIPSKDDLIRTKLDVIQNCETNLKELSLKSPNGLCNGLDGVEPKDLSYSSAFNCSSVTDSSSHCGNDGPDFEIDHGNVDGSVLGNQGAPPEQLQLENAFSKETGLSIKDGLPSSSADASAYNPLPVSESEGELQYVSYVSELQMPDIMSLIQKDLSEPYSIYTYRYFIHNWPQLCFLAMVGKLCVGAIVCKLDMHRKVVKRGYIAMLAVDEKYRKKKIGSNLVLKAIRAMVADGADEVVLETEITNKPALRLYENLGFVRDKRLFRYYLNGVDALRLKLWLR
ncbi:FR47-like protein [Nesidiocoris tenuis]|uniref:FR47-like protein n=1 Tax=Nesidiocoris tenuis TaxID=355587 RepID=A0ABN7B902_9HEMI|nr:FR47-like protein [Nesidiocoris tenuis]